MPNPDLDLKWFEKVSLNKFYEENFTSEGKLQPEIVPLAQGSFASLFLGSVFDSSAGECVVRFVVAPHGPSEEYSLMKEVKALSAYLKLCTLPDQAPVFDSVTYIPRECQPRGLCNIDAYYVDSRPGFKKVVTVMPLGKPLMDVIEEELVSASEKGTESDRQRNLDQLVTWMSDIARSLKMMHSKGVYWRDCKLDNIILIGDEANIIDINSGVCTVGYASHEQLVKLPIVSFSDSQTITDALEQLLHDQPDHQTWETQDVFALSIVVMEWLTYGMFTYPYNRDEPAPSYVSLLLYELRVYNLLLEELSGVYDVTPLRGRLDRKIKHWKDKAPEDIDPTSQAVRDLTLWPLAVTEFRRSKRLFVLWAALAFWDHVDHQFSFIGHWFDWYFDFSDRAPPAPVAAPTTGEPRALVDGGEVVTEHRAMEDWRQRAGNISADVDLIKARLQERSERLEQAEEDHAQRVVRRLSALTQRMDLLNRSLAAFWADAGDASPTSQRRTAPAPSVSVVYADPAAVAAALPPASSSSPVASPGAAAAPRLVEVRLRLRTPSGAAGNEARASTRRALTRALTLPLGSPSPVYAASPS